MCATAFTRDLVGSTQSRMLDADDMRRSTAGEVAPHLGRMKERVASDSLYARPLSLPPQPSSLGPMSTLNRFTFASRGQPSTPRPSWSSSKTSSFSTPPASTCVSRPWHSLTTPIPRPQTVGLSTNGTVAAPSRKRQRSNSPSIQDQASTFQSSSERLFACPFRQYDPKYFNG